MNFDILDFFFEHLPLTQEASFLFPPSGAESFPASWGRWSHFSVSCVSNEGERRQQGLSSENESVHISLLEKAASEPLLVSGSRVTRTGLRSDSSPS